MYPLPSNRFKHIDIMAKEIENININGEAYEVGKIYAKMGLSFERFVELLERDFYCPTLAAAPTSSTITYKDTDDSVNTFQIGQPCRWQEGSAWRLAVCTNNTGSAATWYILPAKVSELTNDAGYLTQHQDISHLATKQEVNAKQDAISDLVTIRENASKGATALQSVPSEYVTETELTNKGYATTSALNTGLSGKVDKVSGKQLSTEDFTTVLKDKLNGLSNYDDTTISNAVSSLQTQLNTLVSGNPSTAINSFNEIIAFLEGITDSEDLESIIASIEQQIAAKQDKISDLDTIRSGAAKGATALQSVPSEYITESELSGKGYATTASMNAALAGKQESIFDLDTIRSGAAKGATALQSVPPEFITETELQDKGFATKVELSAKQNKLLKFTNKVASTWVSDTTMSGFSYRCDIACEGVTEEMYPEVVLFSEQASSGDYAPVSESKDGYVSIWSKKNISVTIPTIVVTT